MSSDPLKISIALCTFNGQAYLPQQLESLLGQSRLPDEIVACDDGSTDATVAILNEFAKSVSFPVRVHQNQSTLGPAQNFARAIAACTGEIISLCDQDDIWDSTKIQRTLAAFESDTKPAFAFSDADICDAECQPMGYRLWTSVGFTGSLRQQFDSGQGLDVLLRQNVVTGATLSFAAKYRSLILPIAGGWMHDGWIALLLSAVSHGIAIDQPLIRYRQHANQSIGAERRSLYQQYLNARQMDRRVFANQADEYESALARLQEQTDYDVPAEYISHLQQKIFHSRNRSTIRLRQKARLPLILTELLTGRYNRFSLGIKSMAQDLFL